MSLLVSAPAAAAAAAAVVPISLREDPTSGRRRRLRRAFWVSLCLLPLLWLGLRWAAFRTEVEIVATPTELTFRVNSQSATATAALPVALREIAIRARDSIDPPGGEALRIEPADGSPLSVFPLPRRFAWPTPQPPPAADWFIDDRLREAVVFRQAVTLRAPFRLRATFFGRGYQAIGIELRESGAEDVTPPLRCEFRSGLLNNDFYIAQGTNLLAGGALHAQAARQWRQLCELPLRGLFAGCLLVIGFALPLLAWRGCGIAEFPQGNRPPRRRKFWQLLAPAVLSCAGFLLAAWTAHDVLDGLPHFQDDFSYLLRARWLLTGHLDRPAPPAELRPHFDLPFVFCVNDRWLSQYPIGWPLLLALGAALGAPWLVAPACGALAILFTCLLGRAVGRGCPAVGWMAGTCLLLSPLSTVLSASLMSHGATAAALAGFAWLLVRGGTGLRRPWLLAGAGGALGFAFCIRPLTAVAVAAPASIWLLSEAVVSRWPRRTWSAAAALLAGGTLGALPALLDNWATTGSPLTFAYKACVNVGWSLRGALPASLLWADTTTALIAPMAFGWGWPWLRGAAWLALPLGFAAVPFLAGRATRLDGLLLGTFSIVPAAYLGFEGFGSHGFGPRYYADVFFALFVLVARGFQVLGQLAAASRGRTAARWCLAALFVLLSLSAAITLPGRLRLYRGYNAVDGSWQAQLASLPPRALVLLEGDGIAEWLRVASLVQTDLADGRIFARSVGDNAALFRAFPDRPVFLMHKGSLQRQDPAAKP